MLLFQRIVRSQHLNSLKSVPKHMENRVQNSEEFKIWHIKYACNYTSIFTGIIAYHLVYFCNNLIRSAMKGCRGQDLSLVQLVPSNLLTKYSTACTESGFYHSWRLLR
ncbi:hypothetical protein NPIL_31491 [Nephila pilipes]|uniref:Uncharacterized protein n=1 Tax=Nephila pilipes TaxID=299642 RepID=A0A8X6PJ91_NEPPI|nr:hypothetical protein NPIL_31491 [Nephila pilipes]